MKKWKTQERDGEVIIVVSGGRDLGEPQVHLKGLGGWEKERRWQKD